MKAILFFKRLLVLSLILICTFFYSQIIEGFQSWAPRLTSGNWSQTTSVGTWFVSNGRINPTGNANGVASAGYVYLEKAENNLNGGIITLPNINKGGVASIEIIANLQTKTAVKDIPSPFKIQKSINDGQWIDIITLNPVSNKAMSYKVDINDYSDNIKLRIYNSTGSEDHRTLYIYDVKVNHSFVLSTDKTAVCIDSPVILKAESFAPFNYTWTSSAGGNLLQTTGNSVTANPSQSATYTAIGTYTTAFGTVTDTKVINVGMKTLPTATLTGGGTIDTEPGSVNLQVSLTGTAPWSLTYTSNGVNPQTITGITNSPYILTVSPETNTDYALTSVSDAVCNNSNSVGISSVLVNKTVWREKNNAINWSNGIPNMNVNTYIYEPYVTGVDGSFVAKNLTINNNGLLTVSPNTVVTAEQYINNSTADRIIVESDANIMQSSELSNIGDITVRRVANMAKMHYTYWSSPVSNQNLYSFSDGGLVGGTPKNRFYIYNESNDLFNTSGINDMYSFRAGQGYAIRGKDSYNTDVNSPAPYTFTFTGVPNNGSLAYQYLKWTNADHGFNLVGNPYPSNLDFDALYDANSSLIYGTAFFWTNQQYIPGQQGSDYAGSNYAIYNRSGGVPSTFQDGVSSPTPTQYIKVGQGFLVQSMAGSNNQPLQFNNSMRSYSPSSIFFNKGESQKSSKDRFWLNLKSPSNINNTILLSYIPGATDGYERLYDADLLVVGSDAFYSVNGSAKLAIQGRKYPLNPNDVVTLGAKYYETGDYTITLGEKEGLFNGEQTIYLKDKKLNKVVNLTLDNSYKFIANAGIDESRFDVIYHDSSYFEPANRNVGNVNVIKEAAELIVIDTKNPIKNVDVFDTSGKLIRSFTGNNSKEIKLSTIGFVKGVYILKITSEKGIVTTKKIIL